MAARRERFTQSILQPFDNDVTFGDKDLVAEAPDLDRRTQYRLEAESSRRRKITLLRLAIVAAITAYAALLRDASAAGPLLGAGIKAMPVLLMVTLVLILAEGHGSYTHRVASGLAASAVGDILLDLVDTPWLSGMDGFLGGLCAFLAAHVCYISAFSCNELKPTLLTVGPAVGCVVGIFLVLQPGLGPGLAAPVLAYSIAIGLMLVAALSRNPEGYASLWSWRCGAVGASVFALSDAILGYNRFVAPVTHAKWLIMGTYWLAQYLIAMSTRGAQKRPITKALGSVENFSMRHKLK